MATERMSFLEELLADESNKSDSRKRNKSVRFTDDDDVLEGLSLSSARPSRTKSAQPLSQVTDVTTEAKDSTATRSVGRSDWLGLLEDEGQTSSGSLRPSSRPILSMDKTQTPQASSRSSESWLDQGLEERRSKEQRSSITTTPSSSASSSAPLIRPKSSNTEPDWLESSRSERSKQVIVSEADVKSPKDFDHFDEKRHDQLSGLVREPEQDENLMKAKLVLQAKVDILEMEKKHLMLTMEQLRENHLNELSTLKSLHSQQLSMTSEMFKKQEEMLIEEKNRRINDLKNQLETSESEKETLRNRYAEKVDFLERECREETEKLKEMHKSLVQRLSSQHESDIERLRRIKGQELDALNALHSQSNSLESLIQKWQANADRIENIHQSIISKEEEVFQGKLQALESKDKRLDIIEENWLSLKREMERERTSYHETRDRLTKLVEDQRNLVTQERSNLMEERKVLDEERKSLEADRMRSEVEFRKQREQLAMEMKEMKEQSHVVEEKTSSLTRREAEFLVKESEWKQEVAKGRDEMTQVRNELLEERRSLMKEKNNVQESLINFQNEQQLLEHKKMLFDSEKEKLKNLAEKIAEKAKEVEMMGEMVVKEKVEVTKALETNSVLKEETDRKLKRIEKKVAQIAADSAYVEAEKHKIQDEWRALREIKGSIVCSLCSDALNKGFGFPTASPEDTDQMLLIWKIAAEEDSEELAREQVPSAADESGTAPPPPARGPGARPLQSSSHYTSSGGGRGYYLYEHHGGHHHYGLSDRDYDYRSSASSSLYARDRDRTARKDYLAGYTGSSRYTGGRLEPYREANKFPSGLCPSSASVAAAAAATGRYPRSSRGLGLISGTSSANYSSLLSSRHSKFDASTDSHHQPPSSSQDAFFYGGMTSGGLDSLVSRTRSSTHRKVPDRSSGQSSSLLCRCGSGGALLPPPSSSPPGIPPASSCFTRGAQSLPSTPNTNRRLISPSPRLDRSSRANIAPERKKQDHNLHPPPGSVPIPPPTPLTPGLSRSGLDPCPHPPSGYSNSNVDCGAIGFTENSMLAPAIGMDADGRRSGARVRALNQVWTQQNRSLRYQSATAKPLTKVSSLVIGVIAALIIGFIVLSPLFHILIK